MDRNEETFRLSPNSPSNFTDPSGLWCDPGFTACGPQTNDGDGGSMFGSGFDLLGIPVYGTDNVWWQVISPNPDITYSFSTPPDCPQCAPVLTMTLEDNVYTNSALAIGLMYALTPNENSFFGDFTIGIRAPNQTYKQCILQNASNYSLAGLTDLAVGANGKISGNFVAGAVGGNDILGAYSALNGSGSAAAETAAAHAGEITKAGMGKVLSYGRRTTDLISLNLAGKGGLPLALSSSSTIGAKGFLEHLGSGLDAALKGAIDAGFTAAEAFNCIFHR